MMSCKALLVHLGRLRHSGRKELVQAGGAGWNPGLPMPVQPSSGQWAHWPGRAATVQAVVLGAHSRECQGSKCRLSTLVSASGRAGPLGKNFIHAEKYRE